MKNKLTPLVLFILLSIQFAHAQKQAERWFFGLNAGLNFNSGSPVPVSGALNTAEGCSSIADANGQTLFYTDGITVYDRRDSIMANSGDLMGDISSTQSALIVPKPGNANIYYIFTTAADGGLNGFRYSTVDLTLNNGYGDVASKNILIKTPSTEKVSAASIYDGSGYWVMMHEWGTDVFNAYQLTATGFNTTPVVSHTGTVHSDANGVFQNCYGQMKFSHDGKKLVVDIYKQGLTELFNFNDTTGVVSDPITIPITDRPYGAEFSGNNTKLYVSTYNSLYDAYYLYQFDISSGIRDTILASQTTVGSADVMRALQIGPDKKIYVAQAYHGSLGVIHAPDSLGTDADFVGDEIIMDGFSSCELGLPGFVQTIFKQKATAAFTAGNTTICPGTCINFTDLSLNQPISWKWKFAGANPDTSSAKNPQNICYPNAGFYAVTLIVDNGAGTDTVKINSYVNVLQSPSISISVQGDTFHVYNGASYQWMLNGSPITGATGTVYIATVNGSYTVEITDSAGCTATSSAIAYVATGLENITADGELSIFPVPATDQLSVTLPGIFKPTDRLTITNLLGQTMNTTITKPTGNNINIDIKDLASGVYILRYATADKVMSKQFVKK